MTTAEFVGTESVPVRDPLTVADVVDWLTELEIDGKKRIADAGLFGIRLVSAESVRLLSVLGDIRLLGAPAAPPPDGDDYTNDALIEDDIQAKDVQDIQDVAEMPNIADIVGNLTGSDRPTLTDGRMNSWRVNQALAALGAIADKLARAAAGGPAASGVKPSELREAQAHVRNLMSEANDKRGYVAPDRTKPAVVVDVNHDRDGSSADGLERQVRRAMTVVLGQTAPSDPKALGAAIRQRFGRSTSPTYLRLTPLDGHGPGSDYAILPPNQVILLNEARGAATDALGQLDGLTPDISKHDSLAFSQAKAAVSGPLLALVAEFGREDGPRTDKVEIYLESLRGALMWLLDTAGVNEIALSPAQEELDLRYRLISRSVWRIRSIWKHLSDETTSISFVSARLLTLLTIVGESNRNWAAAMEEAGLSVQERRFVELKDGPILRRVMRDDDVVEELDDLSTFLAQIPVVASSVDVAKITGDVS